MRRTDTQHLRHDAVHSRSGRSIITVLAMATVWGLAKLPIAASLALIAGFAPRVNLLRRHPWDWDAVSWLLVASWIQLVPTVFLTRVYLGLRRVYRLYPPFRRLNVSALLVVEAAQFFALTWILFTATPNAAGLFVSRSTDGVWLVAIPLYGCFVYAVAAITTLISFALARGTGFAVAQPENSDVSCPSCRYDLSRLASDRCPECAARRPTFTHRSSL